MDRLSKIKLLAHRQCSKRLWLETYRPERAGAEDGAEARMQVGLEVGEIARSLHPGGVLIEGSDLTRALVETTDHLAARPRRPLFEATFEYRGVQVRTDLLLPAKRGWRLVEVKASASVKPVHPADVAIQAWVAEGAGVRLAETALACIDTGFVYPGGGDYRGLFAEHPMDEAIEELRVQLPQWVRAARATLAGPEPDIEPGDRCTDPYECPFLAYCEPPEAETGYPPEILPRAGALAAALREEGYTDLREIPAGRLDRPLHERIRAATASGVPFLDPEAKRVLEPLGHPRHYLDFETIQFAIPIWTGTRPYQQVPFQWSCHIKHEDGTLTDHGYLAEDMNDPRPAFVDTLCATVQSRGPVFVYNAAFERNRLRELTETYPSRAKALGSMINRLVDLLPLARKHYYHPDMHGSWSLKAVAPTIDPALAYENLEEVANGGMAQEAFLELIAPDTPAGRCVALRNALITYCGRDTFALVRLAHRFSGD
ncbi:MAG TPA: DUF2779 domain-containing protein [Chromatiales bacterium]|nr:hypothetical protein BMS3Bbin13_00137 [bacterium BMS3Bbin13]HDO34550.1 DUF2779 domain-containing protein [Chromatiales bacterium]